MSLKCQFQKGPYCEQIYFISLAYVQLESNRTFQTIMLTVHNLLCMKYTGCPQINVPVFAYNLTNTGTFFGGHPVY